MDHNKLGEIENKKHFDKKLLRSKQLCHSEIFKEAFVCSCQKAPEILGVTSH